MHYKSKSLAYVQSLLQTCFIYELKKKIMITMLANLELIFLLKIIMLEAIIAVELLAIGIAIISHIQS